MISEAYQDIYVGGDPYPPLASFTASREVGTYPITITFTDTSEGEVTSREWKINGQIVSTEASFDYTFTSDGRYTVTLTVSNNIGESSAQRDILIYSPYSSKYALYRDESGITNVYTAFYLNSEQSVYIYRGDGTSTQFVNRVQYSGTARAIGISITQDITLVHLLIDDIIYSYNFTTGELYGYFQISNNAFSLDADESFIYVTEGNAVKKYSFTGILLSSITEADEIPFSNLTGITVVPEEQRRLFVMDSNNGRIVVIDRQSFQPFLTWGTYGTAETPQDPFHFKDALHLYLAYTNNYLFINDSGNNRVVGLPLDWFDFGNYSFLLIGIEVVDASGILESCIITISIDLSLSASAHVEQLPALTSATISIPVKVIASGRLLKLEVRIFLQPNYNITVSGYGGINSNGFIDVTYFLEGIGHSICIANGSILIYPELTINGISGLHGACRIQLPFSLHGSVTSLPRPREQAYATHILIRPSISVSADINIPFWSRRGNAQATFSYLISTNGLNLAPRIGNATLSLAYSTQIIPVRNYVRNYGVVRIDIPIRVQSGTPARVGSVRIPIVFNLNAVSQAIHGKSNIKLPYIDVSSKGLTGITGGVSYNLRITIVTDGKVLYIEPSGETIVMTMLNKAITRYEPYPYKEVIEALGTSYGILNGELYILSEQNDVEQARFDLSTYDISEIHEAVPDSIYLLYDRKVDVTASINNYQYNASGYSNGKTRIAIGKGFTEVLYNIAIETYNDFLLNRIDLDMKDRGLRRV